MPVVKKYRLKCKPRSLKIARKRAKEFEAQGYGTKIDRKDGIYYVFTTGSRKK